MKNQVTEKASNTDSVSGFRYRADIQGLRAIAVLGVLVFHANAPLPGGFLGVDVFFVISGYVITNLILRRIATPQGISWPHFYLRRFMRLAPALSVVLLVTVAASFLLSSPFGIQQATGATAIGAVLLSANFVLANLTGDYFAAPAKFNPLLHTWSLSIEEQIYLVIPALIVLLGLTLRWPPRRTLTLTLLGAGALSLLFALAAASDRVPAAFATLANYYSVTSRLWEFAAGGVLALYGHRLRLSNRIAQVVGVVGLVMILGAFAFLDDSQRYPGPWTLLPVLGTVAVLWAGESSVGAASRWLGDRRFVWVGDRSYSFYLWHWPLVAFSLALWPTRWYAAGLATVASLFPAILVYRWLEDPIRRGPIPSKRRLLIMIAGFVGAPLLAALLLIRSADTEWAARASELPLNDLSLVTPGQECTRDIRALLGPESDQDIYCQSSGTNPALAIIGDSHASMLRPGFEALDSREEFTSLGVAGSSFSDPRYQPIFRYIEESPSIVDVIVTSAWQFHGVDRQELERELQRLVDADKRVHVLSDVPVYSGDSMRCAVQRVPLGDDVCSVPTSEVRADFSPILTELNRLRDAIPQLSIVDTSQYFCEAGKCSMIFEGVPVYADSHHLNQAGARIFVEQLLTESSIFDLTSGA
jgi:peptidoglycan/LPS O-acetylase OafA/YrhL